MNFIEAIKLANIGKKLRNKNWPTYIRFMYTDGYSGDFYSVYPERNIKYEICYGDITSNDWEIYEAEKFYNFEEAFNLGLRRCKKIIRTRKSGGEVELDFSVLNREMLIFSYEDIIAANWRIIEK